MEQKEFEEIVAATKAKIDYLARVKGEEYAGKQGETDRLDNFKRNGKLLNVSAFLIWWVYAGKHWDAITHFIKDQVHGTTREASEPIEGRIDDVIVYCIILKALIADARKPALGTYREITPPK